jgi:hypothetical protein
LELAAHGQQVSGPKQEASKALAGVAWQVSTFPSEGLASYWLETAGGCYLLIARYGARSSASAAHQCQQAAEAVIDSFQLVQ